MLRFAVMFSLLMSAFSVFAQSSLQPTTSDALAVSLAQKAIAALTSGVPISDVTLNGNVISILGADYETGTGTLRAKGWTASRIDLNLNDGTQSDVRGFASGAANGGWAKNGKPATGYSNANCWTDAAWFFPALSSLAQTANPAFIFKYIGQELHGGVNTQHIRVFQTPTGAVSLLQHLSTIDFYLDPVSLLPQAIAFAVHPDQDASSDLPTEIRFAQYQSVNGATVPYHIQRMLNGTVILDVTVTNVSFNTGLLDSTFTLP